MATPPVPPPRSDPNFFVNNGIAKAKRPAGGVLVSGHLTNPLQKGVKSEATTNCSLCTVAGILTLRTGRLWTADKVRIAVQSKEQGSHCFVHYDERLTGSRGDDIESQIHGVRRFLIVNLPPCTFRRLPCTTLGAACFWMANFPADTLFAVYIPTAGHWNCARILSDGTLQFIDYQFNSQPGVPARMSSHPIAPGTGEQITAGELDVLAFLPGIFK